MGDFWTRPRIPTELAEARQGLAEDWQSNGFPVKEIFMSGLWEKGRWHTKSLNC